MRRRCWAKSVHQYFKQRALQSRRRLRDAVSSRPHQPGDRSCIPRRIDAAGDAVASFLRDTRLAGVIREGLLIGGWVAMWRPLEVFLYDWWPIRAEARLFDRLRTMPVQDRVQRDVQPATRGGTIGRPCQRPSGGRHRRDAITMVDV